MRKARTLVASVAAAALIASSTAASSYADNPSADPPPHPEWGSVTFADGTLLKGCHTYTFDYAISPPEGIWALEVFITGPDGQGAAGFAALDGYDPEVGTGSYRLCSEAVQPGLYTVTAKVSYTNGPNEPGPDTPDGGVYGALDPTSYTLTAQPKKARPTWGVDRSYVGRPADALR
jgi:hypothetical protein